MEPRLEFKTEAFQAILDETAKVDPRAKKIKPQDLIDRRYIDGLERNRFLRQTLGRKINPVRK